MGIDITAYRKLTKLDVVFDSDGEPIDPKTREPLDRAYMRAYVNSNFPGSADDVEHKAVYGYEDGEDVLSMGYGGYNHWRNRLAQLAGYPLGQYEQYGKQWDSYCVACWDGATGPFSELINFSDCEGVIGSAVAAKLAHDFAEFDELAKQVNDFHDFYRYYEGLKRGCEMAADGGALKFH